MSRVLFLCMPIQNVPFITPDIKEFSFLRYTGSHRIASVTIAVMDVSKTVVLGKPGTEMY